MGRLTLFLGGARSGKSSLAEKRASEIGGDSVLYLATSEVKDEEMRDRVEKHRASRPSAWVTIEAPRNIARSLGKGRNEERVILIDCITFLVSNLLLEAGGGEDDNPFDEQIEAVILAEIEALLEYIVKTDADFLLVSNEVGMGLVPPYALGRAYRDLLGRANQVLAAAADDVFFLVAGGSMQMK